LDLFGDPIVDPLSGQPTKFRHPGDPVQGTGWLDDDHGDKKFFLSSGPVSIADGDTQEVVLGIVIAQGGSGLESVALLKNRSQIAQRAFDSDFALPPTPPIPVASAYTDTVSIVLSWDAAAEAYSAIDAIDVDSSGNSTSYSFQGYNVYQLDAPIIADETQITRIAGFDVIDGVVRIRDDVFDPETGGTLNRIVQDAQDTGLQRFLHVTRDALHGHTSLLRNMPYYFAVTAYGYNEIGVPKTLESPLLPFEVRPQTPPLGSKLTSAVGDSLTVTHAGTGDGSAVAIIVDPSALTGQSYSIRFREEAGGVVWDVVAGGETKVSGWKNQGALGDHDFPVVDGILVQVLGPPVGINRWISGTNWGGSHLFGGMDSGASFFFGSTLGPGDDVMVDWRFTSNPTMSEDAGWSRANVYRRDLENAFAGLGWIPCQMFDVTDEANPRRLNICFVEDGLDGLADGIWNPISAEGIGGGPGGHEYLFCMLSDYEPEGGLYDDTNYGPSADVLYALWPNNRGSHPYQESDFTMRITPNFVNTERDVFTFESQVPITDDLALARQQAAALVNVFPNPYDRGNIDLRKPFDQFVTFTHLPEFNAMIRIFSLAGDLVLKIEHDNGTQFDFWDLRNEDGRSVASGLYIVHVDMGEIGVKVLKLAVL
jgi:hypothetical protein